MEFHLFLGEQRFEQYFTLFQFNSHFFLHENSFLQVTQILVGRFCFFIDGDIQNRLDTLTI